MTAIPRHGLDCSDNCERASMTQIGKIICMITYQENRSSILVARLLAIRPQVFREHWWRLFLQKNVNDIMQPVRSLSAHALIRKNYHSIARAISSFCTYVGAYPQNMITTKRLCSSPCLPRIARSSPADLETPLPVSATSFSFNGGGFQAEAKTLSNELSQIIRSRFGI